MLKKRKDVYAIEHVLVMIVLNLCVHLVTILSQKDRSTRFNC